MHEPCSFTEEFLVVGCHPDAIQVRSQDGDTLLLPSSELSEVFDSVVRLSFRVGTSAGSDNSLGPIVLQAVVTRDSNGSRRRIDVFEVKLMRT